MTAQLRLLHQVAPAPDHPLIALTSGHPMAVTETDVDFIELANKDPQILEVDVDPDTVTPATMQLAWFVHHVGATHATDGDRSNNLASSLRRYILPFLIELADSKPVDQRGISDLRFAEAEVLTRILAGAAPLPAATVAGDHLRRSALTCVWLSVLDAGRISHGGTSAVTEAISRRRLTTRRDAKGHELVFAADLRKTGLLIERDEPHGVDRDYAWNVLYPFKQATLRAVNLGARLRGNFEALTPIEPLRIHRMRERRTLPGYTCLSTIRKVAEHLTVVEQAVLWLLRLTGLRIGEAYGLLVSDLRHDATTSTWSLRIEKQGGRKSLVRNLDTGQLESRDSKPGTKTSQSERIIRLPQPLARLLLELIAVFHTLPDGTVITDARLIPGIQRDDVSGSGGFREHLYEAIAAAGVARFRPHDLRESLITDLKNAGVKKRLRTYYSGHQQKTVHDRYDTGVPLTLQSPATDALEALLTGLAVEDLVVPTARQHTWGKDSRIAGMSNVVRARLRERGWEAAPEGFDPDAVILSTAEAAARLGVSEIEVRRRFVSGEIRARKIPRGRRPVWVTTEADLQAALADQGTTLKALASATGLTYHRARDLCLALGLIDKDRPKGTAIRLDSTAIKVVRQHMSADAPDAV